MICLVALKMVPAVSDEGLESMRSIELYCKLPPRLEMLSSFDPVVALAREGRLKVRFPRCFLRSGTTPYLASSLPGTCFIDASESLSMRYNILASMAR